MTDTIWQSAGDSRVRPEHLRWSDPNSDPIGDIKSMVEAMLTNGAYQQRCFVIPNRRWKRLNYLLQRGDMTKRQWRRFRSKMKAAKA